ncbi:MAG: hypothetical protein E7425_14115 [Ruminococcaceae bacterium]|nr:hypothetical protein [Oscillospiraceae bacterium]
MAKRVCSVLLALVLCFGMLPGTARAAVVASGTCGADGSNLTWTLDDSGKLTISGTGKMKNYFYNESPFYNNQQINTVVIQNGVTSIGERAFEHCNKLKNVTIPSSVSSIGKYAFQLCLDIETITIPSSVTSIEEGAFRDCIQLLEVTIPASVTSIGEYAFMGCFSLMSITVSENSNYFSSMDDVLFNKAKTELIQCACTKSGEYTVPSTVSSIREGAFYYCKRLTSVRIPSGVSSIGGFTFFACVSLTSIYLPRSVVSIEALSFSDCNSLADVYYTGTETQWKSVSIDGGNDDLIAATIHYNSSGDSPAVPSNFSKPKVGFSYQSTNGKRTYGGEGISYDDNWFLGDSYEYNHKLATVTLALAMAGFEPEPYPETDKTAGAANIKELYRTLGFDVKKNFIVKNYGTEDNDTVGIAMASKTIYDQNGSPVTLLAVTLRGSGYGDGGWAGNFEVGDRGAYHSGFYAAANSVVTEIKKALPKSGQVRVWLTGYSRSAATANLVSQLLSTRNICRRSEVFTYTFATPSNQIIDYYSSSYNNIFNIINPIDVVPMVPPTRWNFGKQGTTLFIPYYVNADAAAASEKFKELSGVEYRRADGHPALLSALMDSLLEAVDSRSTYTGYLQFALVKYKKGDNSGIDAILGGKTTVDELTELIKNGKKYIDAASNESAPYWVSLYCDLATAQFAIAAAKINSACSYIKKTDGENSPYAILLNKLAGIVKQLAGECASNLVGTKTRASEADFVMDIAARNFGSAALMQHWSEIYMAWMLTCDASDMKETSIYKTRVAAVKCPVDVEVYDEAGNLVARTTTQTYSVTDEETGEVFTGTFTVLDAEVTTLETVILGDSKYFVLPEDQNYRIEIAANETYSEGDTMTYSITTYDGAEVDAAVVYENVALTDASSFTADVTSSDDGIETCTLSDEDDNALEPTELVTNTEFAVTFQTGEGSKVSAQTVKDGRTATEPLDPERAGWAFAGWYSNSGCTKAYDFATPVTKDTTVYAKWMAIALSGTVKNGVVTATVTAPKDAVLIAAAYDASGKQISVSTLTIDRDCVKKAYDLTAATGSGYTCKLMLVSGDTCVPLCASKKLSLN